MPVHVVFDPAKDAINVKKHGISLKRAEELDGATAKFEVDDSQDYGEVRWNVFGLIEAVLYSLTCTIEEEEEYDVIRAISLRKATRQERKKYAQRY